MAIAFLTSEIDVGQNISLDTSGANLLAAGVGSIESGDTYGILDVISTLNSQSFTNLTAKEAPATFPTFSQLAYLLNPASVGSGEIIEVTHSGDALAEGKVAAFSGVGLFYQESAGGATTFGANTVQPGSITAPEDGCLFITNIGAYTFTNDPVIDSDFTIVEIGDIGALAYKIQSTAAAENPTWTLNDALGTSAEMAATMAVFRPAGASMPRPNRMQQYLVR